MDARRIDELATSEQRKREDAKESIQLAMQRDDRERDFSREWWNAYSVPNDEQWCEVTTTRLLDLGIQAVERHWDYCLAELLAAAKPLREMAIITMRWACVGNPIELAQCLMSQRASTRAVGEAHNDLFKICSDKREKDLPTTPPLNQQQMAAVLRITPEAFHSQYRAKKWRTKDATDGHARKWWNTDKEKQDAVLKAIREKWPEKIWLENRLEEPNQAIEK